MSAKTQRRLVRLSVCLAGACVFVLCSPSTYGPYRSGTIHDAHNGAAAAAGGGGGSDHYSHVRIQQHFRQDGEQSTERRILTDYNATNLPKVISFCSSNYTDLTSRFQAVKNSTDIYNQYVETCPIDATDYTYYPVPTVDPCALGGFIPYIIGLLYMFLGLAVVCDEFFVPALEQMVERFDISDDVAGATLMAAGGSAPELFTSFAGTFLSKSNVGFGTVVGSAVFNVLFVIAMCAMCSREVLTLTWWPLARDSSCYTVGLVVLALFYGVISPNIIEMWEAGVLILLYFAYVLLMKNNERVHAVVLKLVDSFSATKVAPEGGSNTNEEKYKEGGDSSRKASVESPFLFHSRFRAGLLHIMYDSHEDILGRACVHVVSELKGDVKDTFRQIDTDRSGFIDSTELGEMLTRLMHEKPDQAMLASALNALDESGHGKIGMEEFSAWYLMSEERMLAIMRRQFDLIDTSGDGVLDRDEIRVVIKHLAPTDGPTEKAIDEVLDEFDKNGNQTISYDDFSKWYRSSILFQKQLEEIQIEEEESGPLELTWPSSRRAQIMFIVTLPIVLPLYLTVPDVRREGKAWLYPVTWTMAIVWIAIFSYLMVWWATLLGDVAGIPSSIMGLTILAAGTSIPDLLTSVIVARQGFGDMAVSSSIGSNIFDILIGLPVPWFLYAALIEPVSVTGDDLLLNVMILVGMLVAVIVIIAVNGWRMTKKLGGSMLFLYFAFLVQALLRRFLTC